MYFSCNDQDTFNPDVVLESTIDQEAKKRCCFHSVPFRTEWHLEPPPSPPEISNYNNTLIHIVECDKISCTVLEVVNFRGSIEFPPSTKKFPWIECGNGSTKATPSV